MEGSSETAPHAEPINRSSSGRGSSMMRMSSAKVHDVAAGAETATMKAVHALEEDLHTLPAALQSVHRFYYMAKDARCIFGLQDWSTAEWSLHLGETGDEGLKFAMGFLGADALTASSPDLESGGEAAAQNWTGSAPAASVGRKESSPLTRQRVEASKVASLIKEKLADLLPLSDWKAVVAFQNHALNLHHDGEPTAWSAMLLVSFSCTTPCTTSCPPPCTTPCTTSCHA